MNENSKIFFDYECAIELFCKVVHTFSGIPLDKFYNNEFVMEQLEVYENKKLAREISAKAYGSIPLKLSDERKKLYKKNNMPTDGPEKPEVFYEFVRQIRLHDPDKIFIPSEVFKRFKRYINEPNFKSRRLERSRIETALRDKWYDNELSVKLYIPNYETKEVITVAEGTLQLFPFNKARFENKVKNHEKAVVWIG